MGMKTTRTWIVIADSASAKIYEHTGPLNGLKLLEQYQFEAPEKKKFSDSQGRTFNIVGAARHKQEPHFSEEDQFARDIAAQLELFERQGKFDKLILCMPPETLGHLRPHIPIAVKDRIAAEMPKNLTNIVGKDLPKHFEEILLL
jgi:protein required for attachment to host cells